MAKTKKDEAYEKGVKEGQEGGLFDDFVENLSRSFDFTEEDEIHHKGYKWGAEHRYEKRETRAEEIKTGGEKKSKEKVETEPEPYFYGRDNDRSYGDTGETFSYGDVSGFGYGILVLICVVIFFAGGLDKIIEKEVIKRTWPTYETRDEKTARLKAENKKEYVRIAINLNKLLNKWIEKKLLPRYKKTEIDRMMSFHYFEYTKQGNTIKAKVGVPFRIDGCFTYWGNFLCYSSDNGITWEVQWENQNSHDTKVLLKQKERS